MDDHANLATSTVAVAPSPAASGATLEVETGHGARFPTPPFDLSISPEGEYPDPSNTEIARCTSITDDELTLTRAQYGTSARTVVVGDRVVAAITSQMLDAIDLWDAVIVKQASESVASSTTLQNDDELTFPVVSGKSYLIELFVHYDEPVGSGTPDIKFACSLGTADTGNTFTLAYFQYLNTSNVSTFTHVSDMVNLAAAAGAAGSARFFYIHILTVVDENGTFAFQWAQNTTSVNASRVLAGSVLRYRALVV